jgi:uncharacterized protein (TIGR04255 family)
LNGFTYNWLKPYSTWEELRSVAKDCWQIYSEVVKPLSVTRISLRYINNLELPISMNDFGEYLETQPTIPANLPQHLGHFLTRVALVDEVSATEAIVTQVFDGIIRPTHITIILDIQPFKNVVLLPSEEDEIWRICDQLRDFKNTIFFESLTEKAVRLYE